MVLSPVPFHDHGFIFYKTGKGNRQRPFPYYYIISLLFSTTILV